MEERDEERGSVLRSRWFVASAGFLAAVVAGGVWLAAGGGRGAGQRTPAAEASAPAAEAPAPPVDAAASVCGLDAGDQAEPSSPLSSRTLDVARGLSVPVVDGIGPGVTEGVTRCFAHSPTGAVVAAAGFMKWLSSRQRLPEVTETLMAAGGDRDRMLADVNASWDGATGSAVTVLGYKTEVRGPDEVLVTLAVAQAGDTTRAASWPLVMVWEDGDWKVKPPSSGKWGEKPVRSLAGDGYVAWTV